MEETRQATTADHPPASPRGWRIIFIAARAAVILFAALLFDGGSTFLLVIPLMGAVDLLTLGMGERRVPRHPWRYALLTPVIVLTAAHLLSLYFS